MIKHLNFNVLKRIIYVSSLFLFIVLFQVAAISMEDPIEENIPEQHTITHEEIVALTDQFMDQLVQEIDEDYKVIHFDTKEALIASFDSIATREVTTEFIDFYYTESTNGLYIIPTETPPWFIKENDYNVIQLNKNQVEVTQQNETSLYGAYKITYEFTFKNNCWKITKIIFE